MVTFPKEFSALEKYPGYFWHTEEKALYSVKVVGSLRPLARRQLWVNNMPVPNVFGYSISKKGKKIFLAEDRIKQILLKQSTYPIFPNES